MARHGINGQIWIDTSTAGTFSSGGTTNLSLISGKNDWTFDASTDFVEVTSFGDPSKTKVKGLANASGDIKGFWIDAGAGTLIKNVMSVTTAERAITILPDAVNAPAWMITGKAFFSNAMSGGVAAAVTYDIHYEAGPSGMVES
jgi:hypothetical protein